MSNTTKVGTQVNVITGGNTGVGQLYLKSSDPVVDHVTPLTSQLKLSIPPTSVILRHTCLTCSFSN